MAKNLVFQIQGGIGKCISATAICSAIKKKYPEDDLIVISGYPEVFINNPHVKKSFSFSNLIYFYQDFIDNKDVKLFLHDPYLTTDYITEKKNILQIWCELYELNYNGEQPEFYITPREIEMFQRQVQLDKPMFLMQTNGGGDANRKYSWARDIPTSVVLSVIEEFSKEYAIVHVRRDDQIGYQGTVQLTNNLRFILCVSLLSKKRLVMDSFMQHALAALQLPAVACWIVNSPKVWGYDLHTHITAKEPSQNPELRNSVFSKFNIGGDELEFPYENEREIFDTDAIIKALKEIA